MFTKSRKTRRRATVLLICSVAIPLGCETDSPGGFGTGGFTIGGSTFTIPLGALQPFRVKAGGQPVRQALGVTLFDDKPVDAPLSATISLDPSSIVATLRTTPKALAADQGTGGAKVDVLVVLDPGVRENPFDGGVPCDHFFLSISPDGKVEVDPPSIKLGPAFKSVIAGKFGMGLEVSGDADVDVSLGQFGIEFAVALGGPGSVPDPTPDPPPGNGTGICVPMTGDQTPVLDCCCKRQFGDDWEFFAFDACNRIGDDDVRNLETLTDCPELFAAP